MPESTLSVTAGSGTKLHTFQRTIGANTVEQQVGQYGEPYLATYTASPLVAVSIATGSAHLFQVMAGASLPVYIRRIRLYQMALATTAAVAYFYLHRLSTAGTGGTAVTPALHDTTDSASGATVMTLPTVKGTETTQLGLFSCQLIQTVGTGGAGLNTLLYDVSFDGLRGKALRIPAGTANGIALKIGAGYAGATAIFEVTFSEASF